MSSPPANIHPYTMQAPPTFTYEDDHAQVQAEITYEYLVSQIQTNYAAATKRLDRLYKGYVSLSEEKSRCHILHVSSCSC